MKIHRFFIKQKVSDGDEIKITDQAIIHQIQNVLRLREGDRVIFLDGSGGLYHTRVKVLLKKESIYIKEKVENFEKPKQTLNLYFSMLKKDKAEWVLQKGTELGVANFTPIISGRTEKMNLKPERAEIIMREAAEQSEKIFLPKFCETSTLDSILPKLKLEETIVLDLKVPKIDIGQIKDIKNLNVLVGPEGGWSETDKALFKKYKMQSVSLGNFVLRAETASIAFIAALKIK